jgi:hypothetical protein
VLDAKAEQEAVLLDADAQAKQPLLLAKDWMAMGQQMAAAHGGSVLMVDPQSPASLLAALKGLQERGGS